MSLRQQGQAGRHRRERLRHRAGGDAEYRHRPQQVAGLLAQAFAGRRALLDQGGILLQGVIQLPDGPLDLGDITALGQAGLDRKSVV